MKSSLYSVLFSALLIGAPSFLAAQESDPSLDPTLIEFDTIGSDAPKADTNTSVLEPISVQEHVASNSLPLSQEDRQFLNELQDENQGSRLSPLRFEVKYPESIVLNESAEVHINITNPTSVDVREAKLMLTLPKHVRFAGASPEPVKVSEKMIEFSIFDLFGNSSSEIVLKVLPTDKNPISFDTELVVVNREKVEIAVQQPVLMVSADGPERLIMGEPVTVQVEVTNIGDGPARNFHLKPTLANGLRIDGNAELSTAEIKPGESRTFKISTSGVAPGQANIKFDAIADAADTKSSDIGFLVIKPELEVELSGPLNGYIRQTGMYGIKVNNPSEADIHDVQLTLNIPDAIKIHTVSHECATNDTGKQLTWTLPHLSAGSTTEIQWISSSEKMGAFDYQVTLKSRETQLKAIKLPTVIDARPDVTMTIRSLMDPIPAGEAADYVVVIENHGDKAASDVAINVELPNNWVAISQNDKALETPARAVKFTVPQIAAKQKQELHFKAGSNKAGEYVVRAKLQFGKTNIVLTAEDSTLVFQSDTNRVSETVGPTIR
ncbi:MAG: hypothetical protein R3C03_08090 [Pirellulaceae bacterium]